MRHESDKIESEADKITRLQNIREYMATHTPPQYDVTFEVFKKGFEGTHVSRIKATSANAANEIVIKDWASIGVVPHILSTSKVQESEPKA